ncbi:hypothetical protein [Curtobacterium sp. MCBD17_026]|uniref:hypothetical protein n=1 Tax=Curtobacterium sp. MCBD17_026 TaxID=2175621 RepID=UPI000DA7F761|nr:hypothetical protein [Curtobacterium sp. MCBD17_026]WIB72624.1 hypothetical protein DEI85_17400 [Curtobacterium sp. MCBD17_026]
MTTTQHTGTITTLLFSEAHSPNDGISRDADTVTVVHENGPHTGDEGTPAVRLVTRPNTLPAVTLRHFEPVEPCPADRVGYMASGAWVVVGVDLARALGIDPAAYPLHDRSETVAQYAANSN